MPANNRKLRNIIIVLICLGLAVAGGLVWKSRHPFVGDLSSLTNLQYWNAVSKELEGNRELQKQVSCATSGPFTERGSRIDAILPLFNGKLSKVFLCSYAANFYFGAGRKEDARRVDTIGSDAAQAILRIYPNARFSPGVHLQLAEMMIHRKESASPEDTRSALRHIDIALQSDPDIRTSPYYRSAMYMKGGMLATVKDPKALQVYDELLRDGDTRMHLMDEYERAQALMALGRASEAKSEFQNIIQNHPQSTVAKSARKTLDSLQHPARRPKGMSF